MTYSDGGECSPSHRCDNLVVWWSVDDVGVSVVSSLGVDRSHSLGTMSVTSFLVGCDISSVVSVVVCIVGV